MLPAERLWHRGLGAPGETCLPRAGCTRLPLEKPPGSTGGKVSSSTGGLQGGVRRGNSSRHPGTLLSQQLPPTPKPTPGSGSSPLVFLPTQVLSLVPSVPRNTGGCAHRNTLKEASLKSIKLCFIQVGSVLGTPTHSSLTARKEPGAWRVKIGWKWLGSGKAGVDRKEPGNLIHTLVF